MIRSLINIAGEREPNLENIHINPAVFEAAAKGYLSAAHPDAIQEVELMADAPQIMALELGVRFLADYLRGDNYFAVGPQDPPDLNKIRAMVQFCVFEKLRQNADFMRRCIARFQRFGSSTRLG
jgi:N-acetylhexosamine 1-kinase